MSLRLEVDSQGADQKELNHCRKKKLGPDPDVCEWPFYPNDSGKERKKKGH